MNLGSRLFSGAIIISAVCNITVASAMDEKTTYKKTDDLVPSTSSSSSMAHHGGKKHKRCSLCKPVTDRFWSATARIKYEYNKRFNPKKNESLLPITTPFSGHLESALRTVSGASSSGQGPYVFFPPSGIDSPRGASDSENPPVAAAVVAGRRDIGVFSGFDGSTSGEDFLSVNSSTSAGDGEEESSVRNGQNGGSALPLLMLATGNNSPVPCSPSALGVSALVRLDVGFVDQLLPGKEGGPLAEQDAFAGASAMVDIPVATTASSRLSGNGSGSSVRTSTNLSNLLEQLDSIAAPSEVSESSLPAARTPWELLGQGQLSFVPMAAQPTVPAVTPGAGLSREGKIERGRELLRGFRADKATHSSAASSAGSSSASTSSSVLRPFQPVSLLPSQSTSAAPTSSSQSRQSAPSAISLATAPAPGVSSQPSQQQQQLLLRQLHQPQQPLRQQQPQGQPQQQ